MSKRWRLAAAKLRLWPDEKPAVQPFDHGWVHAGNERVLRWLLASRKPRVVVELVRRVHRDLDVAARECELEAGLVVLHKVERDLGEAFSESDQMAVSEPAARPSDGAGSQRPYEDNAIPEQDTALAAQQQQSEFGAPGAGELPTAPLESHRLSGVE